MSNTSWQPTHADQGRVAGDGSASLGAIVTGVDYRALGVVRSLGRHGIPVWVLVQDEHWLAAFSRYARRYLFWPGGDELSRVGFLREQAKRNNLVGWLLIPTDDDTLALVGRHQNLLAEFYRLTSPAWEELRWASDKRLTCQLARELGLAIPWTACPKDREELEALDCPFPAILKPATREGIIQVSRAKAWRVGNRGSLLERYDRMSALCGPDRFMVQEIIPGWGEAQFSYAALCEEGRPLVSVVAQRTRQIPMDFGRFSTYVETVDEPGVVEPAVRLLAAMHLTGLVEVEFKRDPRDCQFKLLDVNPRVWGWHTLCQRAGVDFPYLLWLFSHGKPVPHVQGRPGVRWVRMSADLPIAILEIVHGRLSLLEYARSLGRPRESAIFAYDDPLPGLLELPLLAYAFGRRFLSAKK